MEFQNQSADQKPIHQFAILPAIDLMGCEVVRLQQGDPKKKTVYARDPVTTAKEWEARGGDWLHLVDLDAAFSGESKNLEVVRAITAAVGIPCELGGGIRSMQAVDAAFEAGVRRVVIGTRAAENLEFVKEVAQRYGSERVAVGVDARDGRVAVRGWQEVTALDATEFAKQVEEAGAGCLIYTDIATDGMLKGPNLPALRTMMESSTLPVIASGGVSSAGDLRALAQLGGLHGVIVGKALYDGKILGNLRDLLG